MTVAMYATIWVALALFVAGEAGKPGPTARGAALAPARVTIAWRLWTTGGLLAVAHIPIALATRYAWSHLAAEQETARRTADLFGWYWPGGVYINYVFVAAWLIEAVWWRIAPVQYAHRPAWMVWTLQAFYFVIILNAAVIFASPAGRWPGIAIVAALVWIWRPRSRAIA